jgi:hypothetical protein
MPSHRRVIDRGPIGFLTVAIFADLEEHGIGSRVEHIDFLKPLILLAGCDLQSIATIAEHSRDQAPGAWLAELESIFGKGHSIPSKM